MLSEWRFRKLPDAQKPFADQFNVRPGFNEVLGWIYAIDQVLMRVVNLPIGGSLIAMARKR